MNNIIREHEDSISSSLFHPKLKHDSSIGREKCSKLTVNCVDVGLNQTDIFFVTPLTTALIKLTTPVATRLSKKVLN